MRERWRRTSAAGWLLAVLAAPGAAAPAGGMEALGFMEGPWRVEAWYQHLQDPAAPWYKGKEFITTMERVYGGAFLRFEFTAEYPDGTQWDTFGILSWDRFQQRYRFGFFDSVWQLFDVYEGDFGDDGELVLDNDGSGTWGTDYWGNPAGARITVRPGEDRFEVEWASTSKVYSPGVRWVFHRSAEEEAS